VIYMRQAAGPAEIARFAELVSLTETDDPARDFQIARLSERAAHTRLAAALYEGVERSNAVSGQDLAIVRTNLASQYMLMDQADLALAAAERAIEADESYGNAWAVKGFALSDLDQTVDGQQAMMRAYSLGSRSPELIRRLSVTGASLEAPGDPSQSDQE